jgi:outer membrane lipoprotein-sorting protein
MRKLMWVPVVVLGAAIVLAQTSPSQLLNNFAKTLQAAESLKVDYTVLASGGAPVSYRVELAKPNMARVESPSQTIVADGNNVTVYDKASRTYLIDPQTPESLRGVFGDEAVALWSPFFDESAMAKVSAKSLGAKTRNGQQLQVVEAGFGSGKKTVVYYLSNDNMARQAEISYADAPGQKISVVTKGIETNGASNGSFKFNPPAGSRELTMEERTSGKWFHDLDEALAQAGKLNKLVMVDFNAVWCGPCQRMKAEVFPTDKFKAYSKYFVFVEIDIDEQPGLAKTYGATSIPNVHFLKKDGSRVHQFVGYASPDQVFSEMDKAVKMGGL